VPEQRVLRKAALVRLGLYDDWEYEHTNLERRLHYGVDSFTTSILIMYIAPIPLQSHVSPKARLLRLQYGCVSIPYLFTEG
jgi:hypothetical protein